MHRMMLIEHLWINIMGFAMGLFFQGGMRLAARRGFLEQGRAHLFTSILLLGLLTLNGAVELAFFFLGPGSLSNALAWIRSLLFPFYVVQLTSHVLSNLRYFKRLPR